MQPYTDVQLAKALVLARALFNYDAGDIPADRRIRVRRLVVWSRERRRVSGGVSQLLRWV
jgi:hypothetical protein